MITVGDLLAVLRLKDDLSGPMAAAAATAASSSSGIASSLGGIGGAAAGAGAGMEGFGLSTAAGARQLTFLGRGLSQVGQLMTASFTVPIVGAAVASSKMSAEFETATTRLVSLGNVGSDQLSMVRDKILELAPATGIGPLALADAMMKVSSTTENTNTALSILEIAAKGSAAGLGDATVVAGALTAVINAYGESNITAAQAGNIMTQAIKDGGAEAKELAPTLANVVPWAAKLGVSFKEVAANIAVVTKLGVPTSEAVTELASVFAALTRETVKGTESLRQNGLTYAGLKQEIRDKGLLEVLMKLKDVYKDNDKGLFQVVGRLEALKNIMNVTGAQAEDYKRILENMSNPISTIDSAFKQMANTQEFGWKQLSASIDTISIALGDALAPTFKVIVQNAKPLLDIVLELVKWFGNLPAPIQTVAIGFAAFVALMGPALVVFGQVFQSIGNISRGLALLTSPGLSGAGAALTGFGATAAPVLVALAAITAALTIGYLAWVVYHEGQENIKGDATNNATILKMLADATKVAGREVTDYTEGIKILRNESLRLQGAQGGLKGAMDGATITIAGMVPVTVAAAAAKKTLLEQVKNLTVEEKAHINSLKEEGMNQKQIAEATKISGEVIGVYLRQKEGATAATKKHTAEVTKEGQAIEILNALMDAQYDISIVVGDQTRQTIEDYIRAGATVQQMVDAKIAEKEVIVAVSKEYTKHIKILDELSAAETAEWQAWKKQQEKKVDIADDSYMALEAAQREYTAFVESSTLSSTEAQIRGIKRWAETQKLASKTVGDDYIKFAAMIDAQAKHQIDVANKTYDTLGERLKAQGIFSKTELDKQARDFKQDYDDMVMDGDYTTTELIAMWKKYTDSMVAQGKTVAVNWKMVGAQLRQDLAQLPQLLVASFTGGGGLEGAVKALGVMVTKDVLEPMMHSLNKTQQAAIGVGTGIATATASATGLGATTQTIIGVGTGLAGAALAASSWGVGMAAAGMSGALALGAATAGIGLAAVGVVLLIKHFTTLSKETKAARAAIADFEKQIQSTATAQQILQSGGESWALTTITVRDAYLATGRSAAQAEIDVKAFWESQKVGGATTAAAIDKINQAFVDLANAPLTLATKAGYQTKEVLEGIAATAYRVYKAMKESGLYTADVLEQAFKAWQDAATAAGDKSAAAIDKAKAKVTELDAEMKTLLASVADEAPEEVMGVVEAASRARIAAIAIEREAAQGAIDQTAQDAADAADEAARIIDEALRQRKFEINVQVNWNAPPIPTPGPSGAAGSEAYPQADGGDYWVTKPTLFLAGEAGPERATFSGANKGSQTGPNSAPGMDGAGGGSDTYLTTNVFLDGKLLDSRTEKVVDKMAVTGRLRNRASSGRSY